MAIRKEYKRGDFIRAGLNPDTVVSYVGDDPDLPSLDPVAEKLADVRARIEQLRASLKRRDQ